jgi:opacity protein-like surface antigen
VSPARCATHVAAELVSLSNCHGLARRARVGFTPADRWLVYATGGLAYGEIRTDATVTVAGVGSTAASYSQTKAGWVAGAGIEAALGGGWNGKPAACRACLLEANGPRGPATMGTAVMQRTHRL